MALKNFIAEKILLEFSDILTGQSISKHLKFLNQSQFWTREQIDNYQNEKLRALIQHSYANVPFYNELFQDLRLKPEDIQTKDDLVKLPIITKDEFRKNKAKWIAGNIPKKELIFSFSSGSTGEPFQYYNTKHGTSFIKATAIRGWYWMGYRLGDKYVKTSIHYRSSFIKKLQDKMNNSLFLSFTDFHPVFFHKIIKQIIAFDPLFIRGYPFPLTFLSEQIKVDQGKYHGKSLKAINSTGSTLHQKEREYIESCFNVKVFDSYGCEGSANYSQCSSRYNYHPSEEYAISEFISDEYSLSDPEHPQRLITTDLHNFACPFIRYDTQDYVVLGNDKPCSCGRNFRNIKKIKGRDTDILITPSGKYILMENILGYFESKFQILQVQVVQEKIDKIVFNIIVNDTYNDEVQKEIYEYWHNFIGIEVDVVINVVNEIKLTPAGKRRTVIRESSIKLNDRSH